MKTILLIVALLLGGNAYSQAFYYTKYKGINKTTHSTKKPKGLWKKMKQLNFYRKARKRMAY